MRRCAYKRKLFNHKENIFGVQWKACRDIERGINIECLFKAYGYKGRKARNAFILACQVAFLKVAIARATQ